MGFGAVESRADKNDPNWKSSAPGQFHMACIYRVLLLNKLSVVQLESIFPCFTPGIPCEIVYRKDYYGMNHPVLTAHADGAIIECYHFTSDGDSTLAD